jgi:carbonyl reductase 1
MLVICGEEQVNNAGISRGETDADVFDTNYYGVKRVTTAILPLLRPSSAGARIINVSSSLGELKVHAASQPHM